MYYPIPTDASIRVGHDRTNSVNIIDNDLDLDVLSPRATASAAKIRKPASESDLFGLRPSRRTAREIVQEHERGGVSETAKWSVNEPFRFSVEFWGLDTLKEKNRLHSHTVWYAGSMYNVYVQVIKKKGMQLGVYLHRCVWLKYEDDVDMIAGNPPWTRSPLRRPLRALRCSTRRLQQKLGRQLLRLGLSRYRHRPHVARF